MAKEQKKFGGTIVKFRTRHGRYTAGERAGFTNDVAAQLISSGIADKVEGAYLDRQMKRTVSAD